MLVSRDLKRNPQVVLGACFSSFCEWYLGFSGPKDDHGRARDQVDFVWMMDDGWWCYFFFAAPFLIGSMQIPKHFPEKITQKTGSRPACAAEFDRFQVMINTGARLAQSGVAFAPPPSGRPTSRSSFGQQYIPESLAVSFSMCQWVSGA